LIIIFIAMLYWLYNYSILAPWKRFLILNAWVPHPSVCES
jgi:hypothetical protein